MRTNFSHPSCAPRVPKLSTSARWEAHLKNGGRSLEWGVTPPKCSEVSNCPPGAPASPAKCHPDDHRAPGPWSNKFPEMPSAESPLPLWAAGFQRQGRKSLQPGLPPSGTSDFALAHCHLRNAPSCFCGSSRLRVQSGPSRWGPVPGPWLLQSLLVLNPNCRPPQCSVTHLGTQFPQRPPRFTTCEVLPGSSTSWHTEKDSVCAMPQVTRDLEARCLSSVLCNYGEK